MILITIMMIDMSLDLLGYHPKYGIMLQCEPLFIGISQRVINVRPTAFFYVKCTISSPQVQEFYQCATDGFESTHLLAIPKAELLTEANKMPGCHQGGAVLYDLMTKLA
jgi:hypothetical protein